MMQSIAVSPRLSRNASHRIARQPDVRLFDRRLPALSVVKTGAEAQAAQLRWWLMQYLMGWAQADPALIARAAIDGYRFNDPLVGAFSGQHLSRYFEILHRRFARDGVPVQPAFYMNGPMDGCQGTFAFFREAPQLGLTGVTHIEVSTRGVIAETVAYDLNMSTERLRGPSIDATS
jgi:hypothetical protein